ncbi:Dcp1p-Dcp2p decapping enzyme complex alpha subunit, partial [Oleoguttula sp. CCFEE 5521]
RKMQLRYAINFMFEEILPKLPHGNGGLISACKARPYVSGTDQHILKWKPPYEKTIDFRLQIVTFPITEDDEGEHEDCDTKSEIDLLVPYGDKDQRLCADLCITDQQCK